MEGWFKPHLFTIDAFVSAGAVAAVGFWFAEPLGGSGMAALFACILALAQLVRFAGAQLDTLTWARLQEAGFEEQRAAAAGPDGYRQAATRDDPAAADEQAHQALVFRRRTFARRSLAVIAVAGAALAFVPAFLWSYWLVPGVLASFAALYGLFVVTMQSMRNREARRVDFFRERLARETLAVLAKRPREAAPTNVRVGVDFGVPAAELETEESEAEYARRR